MYNVSPQEAHGDTWGTDNINASSHSDFRHGSGPASIGVVLMIKNWKGGKDVQMACKGGTYLPGLLFQLVARYHCTWEGVGFIDQVHACAHLGQRAMPQARAASTLSEVSGRVDFVA
eukprot:1024964-Pelagomonas_calceolata.AAC.1